MCNSLHAQCPVDDNSLSIDMFLELSTPELHPKRHAKDPNAHASTLFRLLLRILCGFLPITPYHHHTEEASYDCSAQ